MKKVVLGISIIITLQQDAAVNELTKVFQHKGQLGDKLVCYFTSDPICNQMPSLKKPDLNADQTSITFFLPKTRIVTTDEVKQMLQRVHAYKNQWYAVSFKEVSKPIAGIAIEIRYNPKKVILVQKSFDAISEQKGILIEFHFKDLLQELNIRTDGIFRYAYNDAYPKKKFKIVIDAGHGGSDEGKVGFFNVKEKNITLIISRYLAKLLKEKGFDVILTRDKDIFVALDERTSLANHIDANLFVSIHANAALNATASGIETYCLSSQLLRPGYTIRDVVIQEKVNNYCAQIDTLSRQLANEIHSNVLEHAKYKYHPIDRKVKESVAQVLLGTDMPSVLIELGFLSHKEETKLLADNNYQKLLALGICKGIESYYAGLF